MAKVAPGRLAWELVGSDFAGTDRKYYTGIFRAKVPGGWLITIHDSGLIFYPDPSHKWDGSSLDE